MEYIFGTALLIGSVVFGDVVAKMNQRFLSIENLILNAVLYFFAVFCFLNPSFMFLQLFAMGFVLGNILGLIARFSPHPSQGSGFLSGTGGSFGCR